MITNRKGLSDVVTTVLIILLVVVAIGTIWAFVRPTVTNTTQQGQKVATCISNVVEPLSCAKGGGSGAFNSVVVVRRTTTSVTPTAISVQARDATGASIANAVASPAVPASDGQTVSATTAATATAVGSAVVSTSYTQADGSSITCTSAPVTCA